MPQTKERLAQLRAEQSIPCLGLCGRMVWFTPKYNKTGYCRHCVSTHTMSGEDSPSWKGGEHLRTSDGYVYCWTKDRQVGKHRLVMEQHLGRPLRAEENVHHLNGDRADNRIENLELWSSSQPPGQRLEDKVAWAEDLLRLYAPDKLTTA